MFLVIATVPFSLPAGYHDTLLSPLLNRPDSFTDFVVIYVRFFTSIYIPSWEWNVNQFHRYPWFIRFPLYYLSFCSNEGTTSGVVGTVCAPLLSINVWCLNSRINSLNDCDALSVCCSHIYWTRMRCSMSDLTVKDHCPLCPWDQWQEDKQTMMREQFLSLSELCEFCSFTKLSRNKYVIYEILFSPLCFHASNFESNH